MSPRNPVAGGRDRVDSRLDNAVLASLRAQRAAAIKQIGRLLAGAGHRTAGLVSTVDCEVDYDGSGAQRVGHGTGGAAA